MENLAIQLDLIRQGRNYTGYMLQLEADIINIQNTLMIETAKIESLNNNPLLESAVDSIFARARDRFKMIIDAIVNMFLNFIHQLKALYSRIKEYIIYRTSKIPQPTNPENTKLEQPEVINKQVNPPINQNKVEPQSDIVKPPVTKTEPPSIKKPNNTTILIPENILNPRKGFNIEVFRSLYDQVNMISENAYDKLDILSAEDRRSWGINQMLIQKLFKTSDNLKLTSPEEYMEFIYGKERNIKLSSLNKDTVIKELKQIENDIQELTKCAHQIKNAMSTKVPDGYLSGNKVSPVLEYQIKLYTEFSTITGILLNVYAKRCAILTRIANALNTEGSGG